MTRTKMVRSYENPLDILHASNSDEGGVRLVCVEDRGSKPRRVTVDVQGVPAQGVIDSGAGITIMNADLLKRVAVVARLKKNLFQKPDKVPYTYMYNQHPFKLDGRVDLDISFDGRMLQTPVYLKMDAHDPLLLSEGVCHQL